jgi:hypothetical protein
MNSLLPRNYKIGLINCLIDRARKICSSSEALESEIKRIRFTLKKNEYPAKVINNTINKYFRKIREEKEEIQKADKLKIVAVLPYYKVTEEINRKIINLINSSYPQVDFNTHSTHIHIALKGATNIGNLFGFKDKPPDLKKSKVVYSIKCMTCGKEYIGKTIKQSQVREEEHRTNPDSSVYKHMTDTQHTIDWGQIEILDTADTDKKLLLKEMLYINKRKPELNIQKSSNLFSLLA